MGGKEQARKVLKYGKNAKKIKFIDKRRRFWYNCLVVCLAVS
jgi:hypothetical protein